MQFSAITLALAFGSASAFMGQPLNTRSARSAAVKMTTQEELAELAESNRDALGAGLGKTTAPPRLFVTPRASPPGDYTQARARAVHDCLAD